MISEFRRLRNLNILGNPLDFLKVYELYLNSSKFLKIYNNRPLNETINGQERPHKELKRRFPIEFSQKEVENDKKKKIKKEDKDIEEFSSQKNNEKTLEKTKKENKILAKEERPIISSQNPDFKATLEPKNKLGPKSSSVKKEKESVLKIVKKKNPHKKSNSEKIKRVLSKGDDLISHWD